MGDKLKDFQAVILQYPFFGGMRQVYLAKKKYNFKLILNYNMDLVGAGWKGLIFSYASKFFLPKIIQAADFVLASSLDYAQHSRLGRYWRDDEQKFQIIANGVDTTKFSPSPRLSEENIIIFVGALDRAHYFKGVENLIRAVSQIKRDDYKVIIVGAGDMLVHYQALVQSLVITDKIKFVGRASEEEKIKYYQDALATVLPSIDQSESFGIALAESLACGTPVIASDSPGVRSVFSEAKTGFKIKAGDIADLAEKLEYVLNNPDKISAMRPDCRLVAVEKYDWEKIGDKLAKLVIRNSILGNE